MRNTRSRLGESILQFSTNTLLQPAEISLPITTPPCPSAIVQPLTIMFLLGRPSRLPSPFLPLFIAMQSSPVSKRQFSISTSSQDSGSQPSPLGPSLYTFTPRTVMFFENNGCITQNGELSIVTPSINMFSELTMFTSCIRNPLPIPNTRLSSGTLSSHIFCNWSRQPIVCPAIG